MCIMKLNPYTAQRPNDSADCCQLITARNLTVLGLALEQMADNYVEQQSFGHIPSFSSTCPTA